MIQVNIDDNDAPEMTFNSYYRPTTPIMIPDKYYKDFMTGKPSGSAKVSMCPDGHTCAGRCIGFSWVAVIFLLWVGFITDTQPIFIKGIQPKDEHAIEGVTYKVKTANQRLPVTKHAYQASFAYFMTILLCTAYRNNFFSYLETRIRRMKRNLYQDIPDIKSGLPTFFQSQNQRNLKLPEICNRFIIWLQNAISSRTTRNKRRRE